MSKLVPILLLGLVAYAIWPSIERDRARTRLPAVTFPTASRQVAHRTTLPIRAHAGTVAEPVALIKRVAAKYGVPAGALYGIWKKESAGLEGGWGTGTGWLSASSIVGEGGDCVVHYGQEWCSRQWKALALICSQKRNGAPICDPHDVRTSYAVATGPMQHLPIWIIQFDKRGKASWGDRAVDEDRDGVVDPHSLPDAMGMTAKYLRQAKREQGSWQRAINSYYGSQVEGYFEGTADGKKGVVEYWRDWCSAQGCGGSDTANSYASLR